jgi:vesicle-fusing ATPase
MFCVDFAGSVYSLKATSIAVSTFQGSVAATSTRGQLLKLTEVQFTKKKDAAIKLTGQGSSTGAKIFRPDFNFEKLQIGGLDTQFGDIFRRAFASRVYPPSLLKQMGMDHVRGLLLHGPPGCGKTLIARKIGAVLNAREPKIVNGPEILNKYVGQSEENIRELFKDAEEEQAEKGDDSELHIIIFDELDAICKSRGSSRDGTGVGDSVVNQVVQLANCFLEPRPLILVCISC